MQIDKGIPIPKTKRNGEWADLSRQMKVGDSVFFQSKKHANGFYQALRKIGKTKTRVVEGGFRVWRTA